MTGRLAFARHELRRVAQTPRTFANWPAVLAGLAQQQVGRGADTLTFVTRDGLRIECPNRPGARVPIYEIFAEDCYRLPWFLADLDPKRVLDIGGHIGTFANRMAQLYPHATVESFEPSPVTAEFLRRNAAANGFADRITVTQAAVAATSGSAVFDDNGAGSGLNGLAALGHASGTATTVPAVTFDEIVAAGAHSVDVVKIDCEGGEYDLVHGSEPASWDAVARVVIEHHPVPGRSWPELRAWFAERGLRVQDEVTQDGYGCAWLSRTPLPSPAR